MQVVNDMDQFSCSKLNLLVGKQISIANNWREISSRTELQTQVQMITSLKKLLSSIAKELAKPGMRILT